MRSIYQIDWTLAGGQTPKPQIYLAWILTSKAKNLLFHISSIISNTFLWFCISHSKSFLYVVPGSKEGKWQHKWVNDALQTSTKQMFQTTECADIKIIMEKMRIWLFIYTEVPTLQGSDGCLQTKCMSQNAALSCLSNRRKGRNTSNGCLSLTTHTKHSSSSLRALRRASATRHNSLPELSRKTSFPGFILAHWLPSAITSSWCPSVFSKQGEGGTGTQGMQRALYQSPDTLKLPFPSVAFLQSDDGSRGAGWSGSH